MLVVCNIKTHSILRVNNNFFCTNHTVPVLKLKNLLINVILNECSPTCEEIFVHNFSHRTITPKNNFKIFPLLIYHMQRKFIFFSIHQNVNIRFNAVIYCLPNRYVCIIILACAMLINSHHFAVFICFM